MDDLIDHFVLVMAAPRRSGKSYLIKSMLQNKKFQNRFEHIIIMCPSLDYNDDYVDFEVNKKFSLICNPTANLIEELLDKQMMCKRTTQGNQRLKRRQIVVGSHIGEDIECPNTLLILDDIVDSGVIKFKGVCDMVAERGRHFNISLIISSQRLSAISRSIRINSDYFLIFSPYSISEIEQFLEQFVSKSNRNMLRYKLEEVFSVKYQFIILDNTEVTTKKLKISNADDFTHNKFEQLKLKIADTPASWGSRKNIIESDEDE